MIGTSLLNLSQKKATKAWRPSPLVLSGAPTSRWHLIDFAISIIHNRGILTVATVLTSDHLASDRLRALELNIEEFLLKRQTQGFARVVTAPDPFTGSVDFVKAYGIGSLIPNTVILGDTENPAHMADYGEMISQFHLLNRNVVIIKDDKVKGFGNRKKMIFGGAAGRPIVACCSSYPISYLPVVPGTGLRLR